jgi:hypothetical protein
MKQMIQQGKPFTLVYNDREYLCTTEEYGFSYYAISISEIVYEHVPKYIFFGPLVTKTSYRHIVLSADGLGYCKPFYEISSIKEACIDLIDKHTGSVHTERI